MAPANYSRQRITRCFYSVKWISFNYMEYGEGDEAGLPNMGGAELCGAANRGCRRLSSRRRSKCSPAPKKPPTKAAAGKIACPTISGVCLRGLRLRRRQPEPAAQILDRGFSRSRPWRIRDAPWSRDHGI